MTNDEIQTLILTRGIPGSRKTTWAREYVALNPEWRVRVNRDDLRFSLYGEYVLDRHREETVTTVQKAMVETALKAKMSVIIDDTNLTDRFVKEWLRLAQKMGVRSEFVDFNVPLEQALADNKARGDAGGRFVPEDVIKSFHQRFVNRKTGLLKPYPVLDSTFEPILRTYRGTPGAPDTYLVDLDGTIAQMVCPDHREDAEPVADDHECRPRSPFHWAVVGTDVPHRDVIDTVRRLEATGVRLVFLSGRDEVCREETTTWIRQYVYDGSNVEIELFMRPEDSGDGDEKVKPELFWKYVAERFNVLGVFDDRQKVVDVWRKMGLRVYQVAPGDF